MWWFCIGLLGLLVSYSFQVFKAFREEVRTEERENRERGCRCPVNWLGIYAISPECPVHKDVCTLAWHKSWAGEEYVTIPYTSIERIMVCRNCFDSLAEQNMEMFYYRTVGKCGVCGEENRLCIRVPSNLVEDWLEGEIFHFSWNAERRKEHK